MENIDNSSDQISFLEQLIAREEISGAALGIAKQAISRGIKSLSEKQASVIQKYINGYIRKISCERCLNDNVSQLTDYLFIKENANHFCPMCEYDREKYFRD